MIKRIKANDFVKSVSVLMTGTIISQIINYGFSPILSRIYSEEDMGELNFYLRIVAFIVGIATARYEMSLPLPKNDSHSFLLYRISLKIAMYVLLLTGVVGVAYILSTAFTWYNFLLLIFIIVGSLFTVLINLGTNWSIRKNTLHLIARSRIVNASFSNVLKLTFGYLQLGAIGIILATVLGYFFSSIRFIKEFFTNKERYKLNSSKPKQRLLIKEYRHFPLVNLPHSMSDLSRDLLIAFLIVAYFGKDTFGLYSYSLLILSAPLTLIGVSIGQVFYTKIVTMVNQGQSIYPLVKRTLTILFLLSVLPFTFLYFFSEELFMFVFGEKWKLSGTYSEIMVFYYFLNFLIAPLSNLGLVLNRQKEIFYLALINSVGQLLILALLPILFTSLRNDFQTVLWIMTIYQSIVMSVIIVVFLRFAKIGKLTN